jgi:hypothetical protein
VGGDTSQWELDMKTKEPRLRVTKWNGSIPVEAECSACGGVTFKIEEWNSGEPLTEPDRQHYQDILQFGFDEHCAVAHRGK